MTHPHAHTTMLSSSVFYFFRIFHVSVSCLIRIMRMWPCFLALHCTRPNHLNHFSSFYSKFKLSLASCTCNHFLFYLLESGNSFITTFSFQLHWCFAHVFSYSPSIVPYIKFSIQFIIGVLHNTGEALLYFNYSIVVWEQHPPKSHCILQNDWS